jgi:hypothetical protein
VRHGPGRPEPGAHPRIGAPQNLWARQLNSEYGRIPRFINNGGRMAVSFADGGQKSYWTKIKETQNGRTRLDQTWRRETMMYIGGTP